MKRYLGPTLVITALTFFCQVISFLVQVVIARRFGARSAMDAFWVGVTLPQYVISIAVQSLGFVFLPVFVDYFERGDEDAAWSIASGLLIRVTLILGAFILVGMVFARTFLQWTAPGLASSSLDLAAHVSRWTWPTVLLSAWSTILANLYQARRMFAWQAMAPFLGALLNLGLLMALSPIFGVIAVAMAATISLAVQLALLLPALARKGRFRWKGSWSHPGVREVRRLLMPLLLSSCLIRWTPVVDRYLASFLQEGVISHLGYALRITGVLSVLISGGLTTVIFPTLAASSARGDFPGLLRTLSLALRILWLMIAPVIFLGSTLAVPVLTVLFQRGAFKSADTAAVGRLLQIYLLSLGAVCFGNITGRVYYAMKKTRLVAWVGSLEALIYVAYAYGLARGFGASGLAISYVIYFNLSLVWQISVLRYLLGPLGGIAIVTSFLRTAAAAGLAAAFAWGLSHWVTTAWIQAAVGGIGGLALYVAVLQVFGSPEWQIIQQAFVPSGQN